MDLERSTLLERACRQLVRNCSGARMSRLSLGAMLTLCVVSVLCPTLACADERVTLAVAGIDRIIYLPATLAEQLGYFRQEGIEVEFHSLPAGSDGVDELLAGAAQGVVGFYDHAIDLQAKGMAVMSVVQLGTSPGEVVLVSRKAADRVRSAADFGGRRLGVTGLGSSTSFLMQYLAASAGVKPGAYSLVPVGGDVTFAEALKNNSIEVGMTTEPTASRLLKTGDAKLLVDLRMPEDAIRAFGGLYPAACLYMEASWIKNHTSQVQKLVNAFVKALHYIQSHSAEEIAAHVPPRFYGGEQEAYIRVLGNSRSIFTPDGRMPESGPSTALRVLSTFNKNVQAQRISLEQTYTSEFLAGR